ncbi:hypothetical protein D3C78_1441800 [compost metagenome]
MRHAVKSIQSPDSRSLMRPEKRLCLSWLGKLTHRAADRRFLMPVAMTPVKLRECRLHRQPFQQPGGQRRRYRQCKLPETAIRRQMLLKLLA